MSICKGSWGLYPWFSDATMVHPSDIEAFKKLYPYGRVFECVDEYDDYIVLRYGSDEFRVKPALYRKVAAPRFKVGDQVRVKNHPERIGIICDVGWHHKNNSAMYFLEVDGKKISKRYWQEDIEAI